MVCTTLRTSQPYSFKNYFLISFVFFPIQEFFSFVLHPLSLHQQNMFHAEEPVFPRLSRQKNLSLTTLINAIPCKDQKFLVACVKKSFFQKSSLATWAKARNLDFVVQAWKVSRLLLIISSVWIEREEKTSGYLSDKTSL